MLQDILRILTLWFKYGARREVKEALEEGFALVHISTWLEVIPQLIARIHTPSGLIRELLLRLLTGLGERFPQSLIYALTVASNSSSCQRQESASSILQKMRVRYAKLVDAANLVSNELIRVAILWHEMWHEGLEEASRLYFGEHNVEGMLAALEPLHAVMDKGPETLREVAFHQTFGRDLAEAHDWILRYKTASPTHKSTKDLNHAWDLYYHVFRRIQKQLPQLTQLELQYVSPALLQSRDLELAVPGTVSGMRGNNVATAGSEGELWDDHGESKSASRWPFEDAAATAAAALPPTDDSTIRIQSFVSTVVVITSKQRPRKLTMIGSNGREYTFLLKGHEDLRQDERVMQLFGLVNALLCHDRETSKRDLSIARYAVIPLSHNAGIVGWVPHCDTLHQLIASTATRGRSC